MADQGRTRNSSTGPEGVIPSPGSVSAIQASTSSRQAGAAQGTPALKRLPPPNRNNVQAQLAEVSRLDHWKSRSLWRVSLRALQQGRHLRLLRHDGASSIPVLRSGTLSASLGDNFLGDLTDIGRKFTNPIRPGDPGQSPDPPGPAPAAAAQPAAPAVRPPSTGGGGLVANPDSHTPSQARSILQLSLSIAALATTVFVWRRPKVRLPGARE